jgi:cell division protein FtsN
MTHDFAKKPKPASKKKAPPKSQVPGWVWMFTGVVTGVFICFLAYLADITPSSAPAEITATVDKVKSAVVSKAATTATKFDFYTLLPEREVIVPAEREVSESSPAQATLYILQAGSFKSAADADRLRARLILMGLEARMEQVSAASGDIWHRVQVGPFSDRSKLSKARSMLISEGIDTLLLKRKADS